MSAKVNGQPPMVYLEWVDSTRTEGWCSRKEVDALVPLECKTAGFLVREDDSMIVIALNVSHPESGSPFGSLMTIPKICIRLRGDVSAYYQDTSK